MSKNKIHSISYALMLIFEVGLGEFVFNQAVFAEPQEAEKYEVTESYIPRPEMDSITPGIEHGTS